MTQQTVDISGNCGVVGCGCVPIHRVVVTHPNGATVTSDWCCNHQRATADHIIVMASEQDFTFEWSFI